MWAGGVGVRGGEGDGEGGRSDGQMVLSRAGPAPPRSAPTRSAAAGYGGGAATVAVDERRTVSRPVRPAPPHTTPPLAMTTAARR